MKDYGTEATLGEILNDRDQRDRLQKKLIDQYQGIVISYMINMPSKYKRCDNGKELFEKGENALDFYLRRKGIAPLFKKCYDHSSGLWALYALDKRVLLANEELVAIDEVAVSKELTAFEIKKDLCEIEQDHDFGRFFDYDVIDSDYIHISRTDIGFQRRKCFLCDNDAAICVRSQKHSYEELLEFINQKLSNRRKMSSR